MGCLREGCEEGKEAAESSEVCEWERGVATREN